MIFFHESWLKKGNNIVPFTLYPGALNWVVGEGVLRKVSRLSYPIEGFLFIFY